MADEIKSDVPEAVAEEQSLTPGSPSIAGIQAQLNALIDGHTKWIDTPPVEGEDGYSGYDRDALIKERSLAHNALIAMGAPRA
jgi:hypothetical protein